MIRTHSQLGPLTAEWNRLALESGSPFLTHEWLSAWCDAFGQEEARWMVLCDEQGSLRAGACLRPTRRKGLASPTNAHTGHWDVLAGDESARAELWAGIAHLRPSRIQLQGMHEQAAGTRSLCEQLRRAGYRTVVVTGPDSPWTALPASWEEMLGTVTAKLRGEMRRRRRLLEREGRLTFRTSAGVPALGDDLERFLKLEASGWKGRSGTAILCDASTERLYRKFAHGAAEQGWLRLHFLELDGEPIAADYSCVFAGEGVAIKMAFSEAHRRVAPGVLLLAEILRSAIEEGVSSYDFLGEADPYKLAWAPEVRPRVRIWAYRQAALGGYLGAYLYRTRLRPMLKSARPLVDALAAHTPIPRLAQRGARG